MPTFPNVCRIETGEAERAQKDDHQRAEPLLFFRFSRFTLHPSSNFGRGDIMRKLPVVQAQTTKIRSLTFSSASPSKGGKIGALCRTA